MGGKHQISHHVLTVEKASKLVLAQAALGHKAGLSDQDRADCWLVGTSNRIVLGENYWKST